MNFYEEKQKREKNILFVIFIGFAVLYFSASLI